MPRSSHAWIALAIGAVVTYFGGVPLIFGLWSYTWEQADGVVTYSTPYRFARTYALDVRYKYNYQGREYSGDTYRYRFVMDRLESSEVDRVQARYPVGEKVTVAVNPWRPTQAVLEGGAEISSFIWPAIGLAFMFGAWRWDRRRQPVAQTARKRRFSTAQALLVIGAGIFLYGANTLATAWRSSQWPIAEGKVFHSTTNNRASIHRAELWYEYSVGGTRYVAEDYRIGGNATPFEDVAKDAVRRYPVGRAVKVYFNPANPSEAVLEPGVWYGNFVFPTVGFVVLLCAWFSKKLAAARKKLARA